MAEDYWLVNSVIESWNKTTHKSSLGFDTAVLNLLIASITEADNATAENGGLRIAIKEAAASITCQIINHTSQDS